MASNVASHAITFFFFFSVISEIRTKFPRDVWPADYERDRAALHMWCITARPVINTCWKVLHNIMADITLNAIIMLKHVQSK